MKLNRLKHTVQRDSILSLFVVLSHFGASVQSGDSIYNRCKHEPVIDSIENRFRD